MHYVYVLYSPRHHRSYVGCSNDVERRLKEHNKGRVASTRNGKPWVLVHREEVEEYAQARRRERYYKSSAGRRKLAKIFNGFEPER